ncbi:MAG: hypothetical protein AAF492_04940, partial [Verrucomicrobiota bacterium]
MYQNGHEIASVAAEGLNVPAPPAIGSQSNRFLDGMIDEVRISSTARSSNWVWATWLNVASNQAFQTARAVTNRLAPTVENQPATNIVGLSAWLNGAMGGFISEHDVYVYWGVTDGGTNPAAWSNRAFAGSVDSSSSTDLTWLVGSGIVPTSTHYFTFALSNCAGTVWATPSESFTSGTLTPPVIDFGTSMVLSATEIDLAWIQSGGRPAHITVYYGDEDGGMDPMAWDHVLDIGLQSGGTGSVPINGLLYGAEIYMHLFASNAAGTAWAPSSRVFKTLSPGGFDLENLLPNSVLPGEATFNARITAVDSLFYLDVFYGTTDGGTNASAWSNTLFYGTVTNVAAMPVSLAVSNLLPTTNYYTWRMTNCREEIWASPSQSLFGEVLVNNHSGPTPGVGSAELTAALEIGQPADVTIFWGDNDGGTSPGTWDNMILFTNRGVGPISATVTGLLYGVPYFYRAYATNLTGDAWADSTTNFKTMDPLDENLVAWLYAHERSDGSSILNVDDATVSLDWNVHTLNQRLFDHDPSASDVLTVRASGDYFVAFTLPLINTSTVNLQRTSIRAELYMNGAAQGALGAIGESAYIRGYENVNNGHFQSSDHFATLITNVPAGAALEVRVTSTAGHTGDTGMQQASLYVEAVDASRTVFAGATIDGGRDMTPTNERTVAWEEPLRHDAGFDLQPGGSNLLLEAAGAYLVYINMPYTGTGLRESAELELKLDGVRVPGGFARQGYIRSAANHFDASVHFSGMIIASNANQTLSVTTKRATIADTDTPIANGRMSIMVERVNVLSGLYVSRADTVTTNSGNWNPAAPGRQIEWDDDQLIDTNLYAHNPVVRPEEITIQAPGSYFLVYNDALVSGFGRVNPIISVQVNGEAVAGAQTKTHFMRSSDEHRESSASLVFYLHDLDTGDVVAVQTVQDFQSGNVFDDEDALLTLQKKEQDVFALLAAGVSNITTTSAVVYAELDTVGSVYDLTLYWGPTDGGTNAAAWSHAVPFGRFTHLVSA